MARYDFGCLDCRLVFEVERAIADRHALPAPACPRGCGTNTMLKFAPPPASNIRTPRALRTRWSDVAPLDQDGHAMSFTETVKSGKYDHYRPELLEGEMKAEAKRQERKRERLHQKFEKKFEDRAFGKVSV